MYRYLHLCLLLSVWVAYIQMSAAVAMESGLPGRNGTWACCQQCCMQCSSFTVLPIDRRICMTFTAYPSWCAVHSCKGACAVTERLCYQNAPFPA